MRQVIIVTLLTILCVMAKAQGVIQGYIINIEDNKIYLDVTSPKVVVGDVLSVYSDAGYIIHPVTKKKIKKEGSIIADLEVVEVNNEYSVATIYPEEAIKKLKTGMVAQMPELTPEMKEAIEEEQEAISEAQANEIEAASNDPENFTTAEQVVQWHLKSTGLDKMAVNPPRSYLIETKVTTINKKGKTTSVVHFTSIVDITTQRVYTKSDFIFGKIEVTESYVVSNGIGWIKTGRKKPKQMGNEQVRNVIESIDIVKGFTHESATHTLCGDFVINGKSCFELEARRSEENTSTKCYIDKKTGLIVANRLNTEESKVLGYRQFGDYLIPSATQVELDKGGHNKNEILQFVPNYPINDSQFTKEALIGSK